jgi:hypothetical protein
VALHLVHVALAKVLLVVLAAHPILKAAIQIILAVAAVAVFTLLPRHWVVLLEGVVEVVLVHPGMALQQQMVTTAQVILVAEAEVGPQAIYRVIQVNRAVLPVTEWMVVLVVVVS